MIIYSIYKVVNLINGKVYIGFDSNWPSRQWAHFYNHRAASCPNWPFYNALRKYGWENFHWEIIYQSKDGDHCKNVMENYFIQEHNSFINFSDSNGYNSTLGGEGTFGKFQSEKNKLDQSKRRSSKNQNSRWYNNGKENKFIDVFPGEGWKLGRLYQKPTTHGRKWYNNGEQQLLTNNPPEGWIRGMLPKRHAL